MKSFWQRLLGRPGPPGQLPESILAGLGELDRILGLAWQGKRVLEAQVEPCAETFAQYYEWLCEDNCTKNNERFREDDRADYYLHALKLAALEHPQHNAWPWLADLRKTVLATYRQRLTQAEDPWTRLASIMPALLAGDVDFAEQCYRAIEADSFLANLALHWARNADHEYYARHNDLKSTKAFLARVQT